VRNYFRLFTLCGLFPQNPIQGEKSMTNSDNENQAAPSILIVDDEESIRQLIADILEMQGYCCQTAANAQIARDFLKQNHFELILSDINMPGESGLEFIRCALDEFKDVAAVMVTAMDDPYMAETFFEIGVYDYITKPITRNSVLISVSNALHRRELEVANRAYRDNLERMVEERTTSLKRITEELRRTIDGIIHTIALTVETRDPYTAGHQRRVADLARAIALELKLSEESVEGTYLAGLIHDLGKISIPAEILSKPGLLSKNEFNLIKEHPQIGYDILKEIEFPWPIADIVFQHHERIDGTGYPSGLIKESILIEARIIAVADVVEAIASHRPYRPSLGIDLALREIRKNSGSLYDAHIVDICAALFEEKGFHF
jgi:putative two-component system response regulator